MARSPFARAYDAAISSNAAARASAGKTTEYVEKIEHEIRLLEGDVRALSDNKKSVDFAKGDAAEAWHEGTYNIDAARQGRIDRSEAPRETTNHSADLTYGPDGELTAQSKYYGTAEDSARAVADPGYAEQNGLVPSDQLEDALSYLRAREAQLAESEPDRARAYGDAADKLSDRISHDGIESRPLSHDGSRRLVEDVRDDGKIDAEDYGLSPESVIQVDDFLREAGKASLTGAGIALSVQAASVVVSALHAAIINGEITVEQIAEMTSGGGTAAAKSSFSGTVAGGLTLAAEAGFLGDAAEALAPEAISLLVVVTVNIAFASAKAIRGEIPWSDVGYSAAKIGLVSMGAALGGVLGSALPGWGTAIGSLLGAALTRAAVVGTERLAMAVAVSKGWTYFGLVKQDYELPSDIARRFGLETNDLEANELELNTLESNDLESSTLEENELEDNDLEGPIEFLRRGVVGVRTIGYLPPQ